MEREYKYEMGFLINGKPIPDPSAFSGAESDLDTLGKRAADGNLRRNKVAMKAPTKLEWDNIEWDMINYIGNLMNKSDRFLFTYPDPIRGLATMTAYCGDRNWEAVNCTDEAMSKWIGSLKVSIIQF